MAKTRGHKASGSNKEADGAGIKARVQTAALELIAVGGWRKLTLDAVARKAGIPLARVHALFPDREAVLEAFLLDRCHATK